MKQQEGKFVVLDLAEFAAWLSGCSVNRKITLIQNHHTWSPDYGNFQHNTNYFDHLRGMEYAHLQRGFDEIAQNLTTFPDGTVALCRSFDKIPAGIKGANKSGICIENLGNFDIGHDQMTAAQRGSIVKVSALLCLRFKLTPNTHTIVYHHWFDLDTGQRTDGGGNTKTCPGTDFFSGNSVGAAASNFVPLVVNELNVASATTATTGQIAVLYSAEVTADVLNVRSLPTLSAPVVKQLTRGIDVEVYEESGGWCRISMSSPEWVFRQYLATAASPAVQSMRLYLATVTTNGLNVRCLAGLSGEVVGQLSRGVNVHVYEERAGWCRIDPTASQWVYGGYLAKTLTANP